MLNPHTAPSSNVRTAFITPKRCLLAAMIFFALMVTLGAVPGKAEAMSAVVYDKLLHFIAYALLSGLVYGGVSGQPATRALLTLLATAFLAGLDEAIQALMPYRNANWMDWKFDMIASMSCVALLILLRPFYSTLTKRGNEAAPGVMPSMQLDRRTAVINVSPLQSFNTSGKEKP